MANIADFHTHTCYSDGDLLPGELVRLARTKGLKTLSITDHDTVEGLFLQKRNAINKIYDLFRELNLPLRPSSLILRYTYLVTALTRRTADS